MQQVPSFTFYFYLELASNRKNCLAGDPSIHLGYMVASNLELQTTK